MITPNPSHHLAARLRASLFPVLFLLAGWPALVTPLRADNPPTYLFEIDAAAVPGGFYPNFVAVDHSNNVYVTDDDNYRVDKFDRNGNYLNQWGSFGSSNGQFYGLQGIAVDSSNNVYVVDNYRIEKFDSNGNYLAQWGSGGTNNGQFDFPQGIAVDSRSNTYVADYGNSRIEKFDSNGNYLAQWGSLGSGNGQFEYGATGMAVDGSNNVYVADYGNNRIEKFESNGDYLTQWGTSGSGNGQFNGPRGIAVDSGGHAYVTDYSNNRVQKFDANGAYLTQWGSYGSGNAQFESPKGVAVDSSGTFIYVADYGNNRIQIFVDNTNIVPPIITGEPTAQGVATGTNVTFSVSVIGTGPFAYQWISNNVVLPGATNAILTLFNVSFSASGAYSVLVTNDFGGELSSKAMLTVSPAADFVAPTYLYEIDPITVPGGFSPLAVAVDSSNNVYATDVLHDRVVKFDRDGNYLTQWGSHGDDNGQFGYSLPGIAVDNSNNIYIADASNTRIEEFDSNGNYLTQWGASGSGNGQFSYPDGIAVDGSNNIYVADFYNGRVQKFSSNGNYLAQWGSYSPTAIATDSSHNVYVADDWRYSRIEKFDSNGSYLTQWGSEGTGNGQLESPVGVAVDGSNNVYVADYGSNRIEKFDRNGNYLTQWGSQGSGIGQFDGPEGVAVDRSGNFIYVADLGNKRIQVFVNNTNIVPPVITQQPANQTVAAGARVTFSAGVIGAAPFAYRWNFNNVAVPGATNATFTLTNASLSDSGATCSVQVANGYGNTSSSNAVLTVLPILVTTQPASGFSATGAMLNGTVTVGPDETVVWFEWGTDTNYGNIAGTTVVPGDNGSNNVSATLSGLPGKFYHYRLVAANDFGIVDGHDLPFTVGFAPRATTLPPTNGANGATLNAVVNPEGWDTTVYFQWGTTNFANTTPGINIGAGTTPLSVSSFVPGLSASVPYKFQVVAANALGSALGAVIFGDPDQHHYLFSGSKTNITLAPGTYIITAYGALGGAAYNPSYGGYAAPGRGAEMSAEFNFSTSTTLTLLVGGIGGTIRDNYHGTNYYGGGGGGGSFVVEGTTPLVIAGGGGGGAVSGRQNPPFVDGGDGRTYTYGDAGSGLSYVGFNNLFGQSATGGAGGSNGTGGGGGGGDGSAFGDGGGGGGGFYGGGSYGSGSGGGAGGSSFGSGGGGGAASYNNRDFRGDNNGGFGGGGAGYGNLGNINLEYGFGGGGGGYSGGGGGGVDSGSDDGITASAKSTGSGGGGGSLIDSSAIAILTELSGIYSPENPGEGEIIITLVPPTPFGITSGAALGFTNGMFGFNVTGPSGSNVVIQASTDLKTWIPLQTNLLGSSPLYFSDAQSTTNVQRFYRAQLLP